jgi:hypothetical protein
MTEPLIAEKAHSEHGASVASRWMPCPGSIQLIRSLPPAQRKNESSVYADEGTRAHALGELALRKGQDCEFFVGMSINGAKIDEDMADFTQIYVDVCRRYLGDPTYICFIEQRFNLGKLNPPAPMFGTGDFVAYDTVNHEVIVVDLKYGSGVVVEVKGNKQLRYYGLGAVLTDELQGKPIKTVRLTIVQPRAAHPDGVVRSETLEYDELIGFSSELLEAAKKTLEKDAPLVPGPVQCRFCPAGAVCPARAKLAIEIAQQEFEAVTTEGGKMVELPAPAALSDEQLAQIMDRLPILDSWIGSIRAHAEAKLRRGEPVPGFKMVAKRATRKWGDEANAETAAVTSFKGDIDLLYKPKEILSPAQLEKVMGKKPFAAAMTPFVVKQSSGHVMVPDTDPRPAAALSPGDDFTAITAGEE